MAFEICRQWSQVRGQSCQLSDSINNSRYCELVSRCVPLSKWKTKCQGKRKCATSKDKLCRLKDGGKGLVGCGDRMKCEDGDPYNIWMAKTPNVIELDGTVVWEKFKLAKLVPRVEEFRNPDTVSILKKNMPALQL